MNLNLVGEISALAVGVDPEELRAAFYAQLRKDLDRSGMPVDFVQGAERDPNRLPDLLVRELQRCMKSSTFNISQMLYLIDISEDQIKTYTQSRPEVEYLDVVAELIIKRILQKVVTRLKFKT